MDLDVEKSFSDAKWKLRQIFTELMARIAKYEELVSTGSKLLIGFQQGLEFLRRPPIDKTSKLVGDIIKSNETERIKSYVEAGCINPHDGVHNMSKLHTCQLGLQDYLIKASCMLVELKCLMESASGAMEAINGYLSNYIDINSDSTLYQEATGEKSSSQGIMSPEITDYAAMIGIIYTMVKQDYEMQERVVSALNLKSSPGELETYCVMWSLRPFIDDDIMEQAWRLIP